MPWKNSETNEADCPICWEHPAWASYWRSLKTGAREVPYTSEITFAPGGEPLGAYRAPRLGRPDYENPALAKHYRDWCNGRITIPGLRVEIKTKTGSVLGPAKKVGSRIVPLKKVRIT